MQFSLSQFPVEHQTYVRKCDGAKSLRALLAAFKVKTKKAQLLYFEKCLAFITYGFFFIFYSTQCRISEQEKKNMGKTTVGKLEGIIEMDRKKEVKVNSPGIWNPNLHSVDTFNKSGF